MGPGENPISSCLSFPRFTQKPRLLTQNAKSLNAVFIRFSCREKTVFSKLVAGWDDSDWQHQLEPWTSGLGTLGEGPSKIRHSVHSTGMLDSLELRNFWNNENKNCMVFVGLCILQPLKTLPCLSSWWWNQPI